MVVGGGGGLKVTGRDVIRNERSEKRGIKAMETLNVKTRRLCWMRE